MESTGVYWKPIFNILEGRFEVMLVNARRLKQVPGRKTDVKDAEWIAQLLQHGLLSPSFIPAAGDPRAPRPDAAADRAGPRPGRGGQPHPEGAGGRQHQAGRRRQRRAGRLGPRHDPGDHRRPGRPGAAGRVWPSGSLRGKIPELKRALHGRVTEHHRFLLRALMDQVESLEGLIARFDARIDEAMKPFGEAAGRLRGIPGVGQRAAEVIVAELGPDMAAFPTAGHLSSWAGLCPGNDESAGKRRSGKTTKGSQWLRTMLVQVAWAASHTKETIFGACYQRWAKRLGKKKALVALAHKILVVIWHLLKKGTEYHERWKAAPAV